MQAGMATHAGGRAGGAGPSGLPPVLRHLGDQRLIVAAVLTWALTIGAFLLDHLTTVPHAAVLTMYVLAYLTGGTDATRAALADLFDGLVNVDLLMVLAALGAASLDSWAEGAVLLALFSSSNALEHLALDRTRNAVQALMELSPDQANLLDADGVSRVVPVEVLSVGDRVLIRPGESIPADATVTEGQSAVDQSAITGESMPVSKGPGDTISSGTLNTTGALTATISKLPSDSTLAKIIRMVEEARDQKSRLQHFTDAFEGPYAIGVIVTSALVFGASLLFGSNTGDAFYRSMTLLVVASPCALVISTPAATLSALANAARNGILVKGGNYLEDLGGIGTVAFDKTGTLTLGQPRLTDVVTVDGHTERELLASVAAIEALSEHPLASAIVDGARERDIEGPGVTEFEAVPGRGVRGWVDGEMWLIGTDALLAQHDVPVSDGLRGSLDQFREAGKTAMLVAAGDQAVGVIAVADTVRPEASQMIAALKQLGVKRTVMLTGDNETVARAVARQLGVDDVRASLMPDEKLAEIHALRAEGGVVMVGDGVNDAPALATADIGVAMGTRGTDVALETADVVLMQDDLHRLPYAIDLSRRTRRSIRINIAFALSVIVVLILSTLIVGIPLPLGVVGHEGSTIIVVLNGLRLLRGGLRHRAAATPSPADLQPPVGALPTAGR